MTKIVHYSTGHPRNELRVHLKECNSLTKFDDFDVTFVVTDGKGDTIDNGVQIRDVGARGGRWRRLLIQPWKIARLARSLDADIYHFHDPELVLPTLLMLRGKGKRIYDVHEDNPSSLLNREWIPRTLRLVVSMSMKFLEDFAAPRLDGIVAATPAIGERFKSMNANTVVANNYPLSSEIEIIDFDRAFSNRQICYQGGISIARGIEQLVRALEHCDAKLIIAGRFDNPNTERLVRDLPGWEKVDFRGQVSRSEVRGIMAESDIGIVLFQPVANHVEARPNKIFEYMSSGLPVLASDFSNWREFFGEDRAITYVDPRNPREIGKKIDNLLDNPSKLRRMGDTGKKEIVAKYCWDSEVAKILELYRRLLGDVPRA